MKSKDLHWLAGYLEGEGTFAYHKSTYTPRVGLQTTDNDVMERAATLMGGVVKGPLMRGRNRKPIWYCQVYGKKARTLMLALDPYMGLRRRHQIKDALNKVDRLRDVNHIRPL